MKSYQVCFLISFLLSGCATTPEYPPMQTVPYVDLKEFMGDWYVIANIPTFLEKGAHNAVESYRLNEDGTIATTFTFRKDAFNGKIKRYTPKGFVVNKESNAVWEMMIFWPFKGDYRIIYLSEDYSQTVIGREKRDYVWIMAREPSIPQDDYQQMLEVIAGEGYDLSKIEKVPQRWRDMNPESTGFDE